MLDGVLSLFRLEGIVPVATEPQSGAAEDTPSQLFNQSPSQPALGHPLSAWSHTHIPPPSFASIIPPPSFASIPSPPLPSVSAVNTPSQLPGATSQEREQFCLHSLLPPPSFASIPSPPLPSVSAVNTPSQLPGATSQENNLVFIPFSHTAPPPCIPSCLFPL